MAYSVVMNIVQAVIDKLDPPTQRQLARVCKQPPQSITRWVRRGRIPGKYILVVEQATGMTLRELCEGALGAVPPDSDPDADRIVPVEGA